MSTINEKQRWSKRLERCLKDMPDDIMILVCQNVVNVVDSDSMDKCFESTGCVDDVYKYSEFEYGIIDVRARGNEERI